jgi:hypothetical protein
MEARRCGFGELPKPTSQRPVLPSGPAGWQLRIDEAAGPTTDLRITNPRHSRPPVCSTGRGQRLAAAEDGAAAGA